MRAFLYTENGLWKISMEKHPVLYSYRRCPYAMRARMGIYLSGIQVEQREIVFWDKPLAMLQASPKGTVPVLILADGQVIDESRDILFWAIKNSAKSDLSLWSAELDSLINSWIDKVDDEFKPWLDLYKYADRHPDKPQVYYRTQGEPFLKEIDEVLSHAPYLLGDKLSLADIAVFPFVRQFVNVDKAWFESADYNKLKQWISIITESDFFKAIMKNRPVYEAGHQPLWVDEPELISRDQFTEKALRG